MPLLIFANDAFFFFDLGPQNVLAIKVMLRCFELVFGLKVDFCKSYLGGVGCSLPASAPDHTSSIKW